MLIRAHLSIQTRNETAGKKSPTTQRLAQISDYNPTRSVWPVTAAVRERLTRPAHVCVHVARTPEAQSSTPSAVRQEWDVCTEEGMTRRTRGKSEESEAAHMEGGRRSRKGGKDVTKQQRGKRK